MNLLYVSPERIRQLARPLDETVVRYSEVQTLERDLATAQARIATLEARIDETLTMKVDYVRSLEAKVKELESEKESLSSFTDGYWCAVANLIRQHKEPVMAENLLECQMPKRATDVEITDRPIIMSLVESINKRRHYNA